jgi:hypothetical protein
MALSLVYGNVGTSAAHSCCTGSTLQLRRASTQHIGGSTVQVSSIFTKVGYDLKKNSSSWRHSSNSSINRPSTVWPIQACHGELSDLARRLAASPAEDLPTEARDHELPNLATALLGNSKKKVDVEITGGRGAGSSSSRSCAQSATEKRRVICISGPTA